ncbi:MAG: response regulator [Candidatus Scalindua sp.]|nr:response regulator [Candidatus Scalindua sp.]
MKKIETMRILSKKILIVDDEEGYRKVLSNSLSDIGYETTVATCGLEALQAIKRENYTAIVLDMEMPGMDGIELLEQIQKAHHPSNIIIITAYTCEDLAMRAIGKGAKKVIRKPFSMDDIKVCLNEIVD